jgi:hypothetical protein
MRFSLVLPLLLAPTVLSAQIKVPTPAQQIALAIQPLPKEFRTDATVLGYDASGKLVPLRNTKGPMICLADDPKEDGFHPACYVRTLEPFMLRGRELRAAGVKGDKVDSVRFAEVKSGKIAMPKAGALWQLIGPSDAVNVTTGVIGPKVKPLYVIYMPFATPETTGIPAAPSMGMPWLMLPGTAKAHVMFSMDM